MMYPARHASLNKIHPAGCRFRSDRRGGCYCDQEVATVLPTRLLAHPGQARNLHRACCDWLLPSRSVQVYGRVLL